MTPAPPCGIQIGDTVTAPVWPPRTYRRSPVTVTGRVYAMEPHALCIVGAQGFHTVPYDANARRVK